MVGGLVVDGPVVGLTPRACIPPPTNKYTNNEAHNKQCTRVRPIIEEEEDDPRVGGQWRIATLSRRGKCSPAAGPIITKQDYCENYNAMEMQNQQAGLAGIHPYQE